MSITDTMLSASSGPLWGVIGVVITAGVNWTINRRKNSIDATSATLGAINTGHKQLIDSLFQQVKILTEEVERLRKQGDDCDRRHREAMERLNALEAQAEGG
jgi:TolA-binding protein